MDDGNAGRASWATIPGVHEELLAKLGSSAVVSHQSAAALHGLELLEPTETLTVTVPRNRSRVTTRGVVVHRRDLPASEVEAKSGVRVTTVLRTVIDLAQSLAFAAALVSADSALRLGLVTSAELQAAALRTGRGAGRVRAIASFADPLAGSVLESLFRALVITAGLPLPETQVAVHDASGEVIGRVDFLWRATRVIVETDGFAFHSDRASYRQDRERANALEAMGYRLLRFTWEDVVHRPDYVESTLRQVLAAAA